MENSVSEFSDSSESISDHQINIEVLEYDPCIDDCHHATQLFFTQEEIASIRLESRRQANRFAADYPDFVETLEQVYENGAIDLATVHKPLRTRRKRKHVMNIALQWSILDDDDNIDEEGGDDYSFDDDDVALEAGPPEVNYYANEKENESTDETMCHASMRGLEVRVTPTFRNHRKQAIRAILDLQLDMKSAGCNATQIEMGLRVKAVQYSNRTKAFAINQARLDSMELSSSC